VRDDELFHAAARVGSSTCAISVRLLLIELSLRRTMRPARMKIRIKNPNPSHSLRAIVMVISASA
jgi:hypothetical protein